MVAAKKSNLLASSAIAPDNACKVKALVPIAPGADMVTVPDVAPLNPKDRAPVISPASPIRTVEFCIVRPPLPFQRTIALSVEIESPGPATSPEPVPGVNHSNPVPAPFFRTDWPTAPAATIYARKVHTALYLNKAMLLKQGKHRRRLVKTVLQQQPSALIKVLGGLRNDVANGVQTVHPTHQGHAGL